jgi:SWI/SNF-related matrix-associated actin-dependent regulator 1 of chromatin subfamily A
MTSDVLEGRKVPKRKSLIQHRPIIIINYEILGAWLKYLLELDPQAVVIDEAHYIKNRTSLRYKTVKLLCENVPHIVAISGTPLVNRSVELWPVLNLLRPDVFDSFPDYCWEYSVPEYTPWGWQYTKSKNRKRLHRKLYELCMIRRLKKDVYKELPEKVRNIVPVEIDNRGEYEFASKDFLLWLERTKSKSAAKKAKKAKALVMMNYLLRLAAKGKVKQICDWIDNFLEASDEKLVVFTGYRPMINTLMKRYKSLGVVVDGRITGKKRLAACDRFQNDPECRLFFGNYQAAGVGLTLTASFTVLFTDEPWTPGELLQAEDRVHRIGQKRTTMFYYMVARSTIEEHRLDLLQSKQTDVSAVLDGTPSSESELSVFDELLHTIEHTTKRRK